MNDRYKKNSVAALAAVAVGLASSGAMAGGLLDVEFDKYNFSNPLLIDNPYWPLNPDTHHRTWTYIGETEDECVINIVAYNGHTYELSGGSFAGFEALEIEDTEWVFEDVEECTIGLLDSPGANDAVTEVTFDWYAQDNDKNIWYMGEASRDFGDVEINGEEESCPTLDEVALGTPKEGWDSPELFAECTAGSWEAGVDGGEGDEIVTGEPGIVVPSDMPFGPDGEPLSNGTYYMQEVAFEAQDMAKILRQGATLSVEDGVDPGEYENCRKVKEWNPFERGGSVEHKWYCVNANYGPGLVLIKGIGGGRTEVETLVDIYPPY